MVGNVHAVHQLPLLACGGGDRRPAGRQQPGARSQGDPAARRGAGRRREVLRRAVLAGARRGDLRLLARGEGAARLRLARPRRALSLPLAAAPGRARTGRRRRAADAGPRVQAVHASCRETPARPPVPGARAGRAARRGSRGRARPAGPARERRGRRSRRRGQAAVGAPEGGRGQGASGRAAPPHRARGARDEAEVRARRSGPHFGGLRVDGRRGLRARRPLGRGGRRGRGRRGLRRRRPPRGLRLAPPARRDLSGPGDLPAHLGPPARRRGGARGCRRRHAGARGVRRGPGGHRHHPRRQGPRVPLGRHP